VRVRSLAPLREPLSDSVVRLEPLDERYAVDFERLVEDPEVLRNTRVPSNPPPGFGAEWVGRYAQGWRDGTRAGFAILDGDSAFLGFTGVVDLDAEGNQGEIGYVVVREARGQGIAGRSLRLVTTGRSTEPVSSASSCTSLLRTWPRSAWPSVAATSVRASSGRSTSRRGNGATR